jgi:hypothetical protein
VGRAWAEAQLFHFLVKPNFFIFLVKLAPKSNLSPELFSNVFKPAKTQAQIMKHDPSSTCAQKNPARARPEPERIRPDPPLFSILLAFSNRNELVLQTFLYFVFLCFRRRKKNNFEKLDSRPPFVPFDISYNWRQPRL